MHCIRFMACNCAFGLLLIDIMNLLNSLYYYYLSNQEKNFVISFYEVALFDFITNLIAFLMTFYVLLT
jgi:hypothetical protein